MENGADVLDPDDVAMWLELPSRGAADLLGFHGEGPPTFLLGSNEYGQEEDLYRRGDQAPSVDAAVANLALNPQGVTDLPAEWNALMLTCSWRSAVQREDHPGANGVD